MNEALEFRYGPTTEEGKSLTLNHTRKTSLDALKISTAQQYVQKLSLSASDNNSAAAEPEKYRLDPRTLSLKLKEA